LRTRRIGPFDVSAIGLGCMSLSHAYMPLPNREDGARLLRRALDVGYTFLDTAAAYGSGGNETLIGEVLGDRRADYVLASKGGMSIGADGKRAIDGAPATIRANCEESLQRLRTDVIDLYYLHRLDRRTPIEATVGAMADLVAEGKIRAIGLSEISAETLRRAHAVHPIAAVQSEYSPWTRNPEVAVLETCREIGAAFVAFSPVARGFLAGGLPDTLLDGDIRRSMPRFQGENLAANLGLLEAFKGLAARAGCTPGQLCLAWTLSRGDHVIPIPGTARIDHLEENAKAGSLDVDADVLADVDALLAPARVQGARYNPATQADIDTEELAA
jgi:aryl-alcohol dehydrogenase-like predicted oxidoreductase